MLAHKEKQYVSSNRLLCHYIPVYPQHKLNVRQTQDRRDLRRESQSAANQQADSGFNKRWQVRGMGCRGKYSEHNKKERDWKAVGKVKVFILVVTFFQRKLLLVTKNILDLVLGSFF
ncbi:hypothetical protein XENOCAPTIV_006181 [Xenoophorus captivus]|uniref:Uncharacterized protein n=1 Tax=Xenoophorus captivus TaxID=1517983 RepID=A0ABV0Q8B5_9TELE